MIAAMTDEQRDSLSFLLTKAEDGRSQRAENRPMTEASWNGTAWTGECRGLEKTTQRPRITLGARRSFNCTCTDKQVRGRQVGPCKHVISLAREALCQMNAVDGVPF
jgi:hypothetical protein